MTRLILYRDAATLSVRIGVWILIISALWADSDRNNQKSRKRLRVI